MVSRKIALAALISPKLQHLWVFKFSSIFRGPLLSEDFFEDVATERCGVDRTE